MVDVPDPITERENALRRMLDGESNHATSKEARAGVKTAHDDREHDDSDGLFGPRSLGFGLIRARPRYESGDHQEFLFAVTDGHRDAAIVVRLRGTLIGILGSQGEDVVEHAIERLHDATASLPNDGRRYENIVLHHPLVFSA